jgi:hypothetical protein
LNENQLFIRVSVKLISGFTMPDPA